MSWKGWCGPERVQWSTDFAGRIWLLEYKGEKQLCAPSDRDVATLKKCLSRWNTLVSAACEKAAVPRSWIWGLMVAESEGNPDAVSPAGALGLMQIMPMHAHGRNLRDPSTNISIACELIADLQKHPKGPWDLMEIASQYNAGPDPRGGPKRSLKQDFGMVNEVGDNEIPANIIRRSVYLRKIAACNNWALEHEPDASAPPAPPTSPPNTPPTPASSSHSGALALALALTAAAVWTLK